MDPTFVPIVSFWRDFHPSRHLHRVGSIVTTLINGLAQHDLVRRREWGTTPEQRQEQMQRICAWARANAGRTERQRLLDLLARDQRCYEAEGFAERLIELQATEAVPVILSYLDRQDTDEYNRASILHACARLDGAQALARAQGFLHDPQPAVRIHAGVIVLRWGDREAGQRAIADGLAKGDYGNLSLSDALVGVEQLLALKTDAGLKAAAVVFERDYFTTALGFERRPILDAFAAFADRCTLPHRYYLRRLRTKGNQFDGATYGEPVAYVFAAEALEVLGHGEAPIKWRYEATAEEKDAIVLKVIEWLESEIARIDRR